MAELFLACTILGMVSMIVIVISYGLRLHHEREMFRHHIRSEEIRENAQLMREAMEKGLQLPQKQHDRYS